MDLEEARLEGKKLFRNGMSVAEWFNSIEMKCGCHKAHLILAVAPFEYVALSQHTMSTYGKEIMLCLATKIAAGECVHIQDRYFFFTDSVDAAVFKVLWQHK